MDHTARHNADSNDITSNTSPQTKPKISDREGQALLERFQIGEEGALDELLKAYTPMVFAILMRRFRLSSDDADDLFWVDMKTQIVDRDKPTEMFSQSPGFKQHPYLLSIVYLYPISLCLRILHPPTIPVGIKMMNRVKRTPYATRRYAARAWSVSEMTGRMIAPMIGPARVPMPPIIQKIKISNVT